jgi:alpha-L-rhamnosidase
MKATTMKPTLILTTLLLVPLAAHAIAPTALKTEFLENSLGIDTAKPRFSWIVEDLTPGAKQTAYQVQAASSPAKLETPDLWDSGRLASGQSHLVEYAGKALGSRQQVWWRVKTWDKDGKETGWSKPAQFEVALLADSDWSAQWIHANLTPENNDAAQAWMRMTTVPVVEGNLAHKPDEPFSSAPKADASLAPDVMRTAEAACRQRLEKLDPCPLLRREINLNGAIRRARAYVAAPGFFELRINGRKVGDRELEPGVTPFPEQVLYAVHDITPFLREGTNAVGLILGHGWFDSSHIGYCVPISNDPVARAQFEIEFADGRRVVVGTDETWKCAPSPILKDSHWLGECFDARRELAGWDQAGFNAGAWKNCLATKSPTKRLAPDLVPPERVMRRVKAKRLYSPTNGVWVYDMGEAFSGAAELTVNVPAGTMLTLRYAQRVFAPDQGAGSLLHYDHFRHVERRHGMIASSEGSMGVGGGVAGRKYQAFAPTDVYVARGGGTETWRRRFGYTAYRYVELTGYPGTPPEDAVTGVVVHTDLPRQGTFECSNELLNRIYAACVNTFLYCTHGFTQDNPTREKQFTPWAPAIYSWMAAKFGTPGLGKIWTKVIDASVFTQDASGHFLPFFGFRENYECPGTESGSIPLAYELWLRYGDDRPLRRSLDGFAAYLDYYFNNPQNRRDKGLYPTCKTAAPDLSQGLLRGGMYTFDWYDGDTVVDLPPAQKGLPPLEPRRLMWGTGILCEDLARFIAMARHAGRDDLVSKYSALLDAIRAEMRKALFNATTGSYGCQGSDALALTAGVATPDERPRIVTAIVNDIAKRGGRFTTGTHGFPRLLAVLSENGHADVAFQLVTREGYPGLANLLQTGNGTFGETWNTWRTPYGAVGGMVQSERGAMGFWFTEWLGGIRPDPAHPGGQHILLNPVFPAKLDSARAEVPSPSGPIASEWRREGDSIRWNVTVPWNMAATVKFPDGTTKQLESGHHKFVIPEQRKP